MYIFIYMADGKKYLQLQWMKIRYLLIHANANAYTFIHTHTHTCAHTQHTHTRYP